MEEHLGGGVRAIKQVNFEKGWGGGETTVFNCAETIVLIYLLPVFPR